MTKKKKSLKGKSPRSFYAMTSSEAKDLIRRLGKDDNRISRIPVRGNILAK